jgi:hypothetical protein
LAEGEELHPENYTDCRHAKEEMQNENEKSQRKPRSTTGKLFSSNPNTPGMFFAAALRGKREEQQ